MAKPQSWRTLISTLLIVVAVIGTFSYGSFIVAAPFGLLRLPSNRVAVFLAGATLGEAVALGVLALMLRRRGHSVWELGVKRRIHGSGLLFGLAVALLYTGATVALNPFVRSHLLQFSAVKLEAIVAALVAGVVEETIFRAYLMDALAAMGKSPATQVVVSALLFALAHFYLIGGFMTFLVTVGLTFVLGLGLALAYLLGGRSLAPVAASHALVDLVIEPWLLLRFFTPI